MQECFESKGQRGGRKGRDHLEGKRTGQATPQAHQPLAAPFGSPSATCPLT